MFNADFYPSNPEAIENLIGGLNLLGKVVLEPSVGTGNLVKAIQSAGAKEVLGCENDQDLLKIARTHCQIIEEDFLKLTSERVSHVDFIVMNPPFSRGADHITHAFSIAPPGCKIISLCNYETIKNPYSKSREGLKGLIETYGQFQELGEIFTTAQRTTNVNVAIIRLEKPSEDYSQEFAGFFMDEDPAEPQSNGLMSYNAVRDLVNRYIECVKIYDDQLETAVRLNEMRAGYFDNDYEEDDRRNERSAFSMSITRNGVPVARNEFKKRMQKAGWRWIFQKMNLNKHSTKGLREDINKFVEQQENIPFTMRNIYRMLEIVISTTSQRMDKAILEVFDKVTRHSHDNHYHVEGWKTNSHYLLTKRFIIPGYYKEEIEDMVKALCYLQGENYDDHLSFDDRTRYHSALVTDDGKITRRYEDPEYAHVKNIYYEQEAKRIDITNYPGCKLISLEWEYGKWFDWGFFKARKYKKGTIHFEFKDEKVWANFNQRVAKIKGYPLPEQREQTAYQQRQNGRKPEKKDSSKKAPIVLATITI
jgi:hypothetical protein